MSTQNELVKSTPTSDLHLVGQLEYLYLSELKATSIALDANWSNNV